MSVKLKIKLSIANRIYPLTIQAHQEEGLRKAAKNIQKMIIQYEQNYSVKDKQDVLAMCALQYATELEQHKINSLQENKEISEELQSLCDLIDSSKIS